MKEPLFQPAPRPDTLSAAALIQIKDLLLDGKLMPGEQLSLRSTAAALGMSVMPVREAVKQLVAEHALEATPNRAVRVPVMSAAQFEEITRIRLEVEGFAVERACERISAETCKELEDLNGRLAAAMDAPDNTDSLVSLNKKLHFVVYHASGMPMLVKIIESLWLRIGPILNYDLRNGSERTRNKTAVAHHARLIAGLAAGDAHTAREGLYSDIQSAYDYIAAKQYGNADKH